MKKILKRIRYKGQLYESISNEISVEEYVDFAAEDTGDIVRVIKSGVYLPTQRGKVEMGLVYDTDIDEYLFIIPGFYFELPISKEDGLRVFDLFQNLNQETCDNLEELLLKISAGGAHTYRQVESIVNNFEADAEIRQIKPLVLKLYDIQKELSYISKKFTNIKNEYSSILNSSARAIFNNIENEITICIKSIEDDLIDAIVPDSVTDLNIFNKDND